jgi:hypothetical protein
MSKDFKEVKDFNDSSEYKIESFEEYWGTLENVVATIANCDICGAKMVFSHLPDYKNLLVQETARCTDCGEGQRKRIHIIN